MRKVSADKQSKLIFFDFRKNDSYRIDSKLKFLIIMYRKYRGKNDFLKIITFFGWPSPCPSPSTSRWCSRRCSCRRPPSWSCKCSFLVYRRLFGLRNDKVIKLIKFINISLWLVFTPFHVNGYILGLFWLFTQIFEAHFRFLGRTSAERIIIKFVLKLIKNSFLKFLIDIWLRQPKFTLRKKEFKKKNKCVPLWFIFKNIFSS